MPSTRSRPLGPEQRLVFGLCLFLRGERVVGFLLLSRDLALRGLRGIQPHGQAALKDVRTGF